MRTSIALVLLAVLPAAATAEGITVGEEFTVCAEGPGKNARGTPAVTRGGDCYLAVWREGWHGRGGNARIFAARISSEGKVLDPKGIQVAPSSKGVQVAPRVAFGGGSFLVVWQDLRNGRDHDILAARVSPEGRILDSRPIPVAAAPRSQVLPDVASDGRGFLVVWQGMKGEDTGYRGLAAPVGADGKVGTAVETGATPMPRVSWNGEKHLAICGISETLAVLLGTDGKPLNKPVKAIGRSKGASFSVSGVPGKGWLVIGHRSPPDPWGWGGPGAMRCGFAKADGTMENNAVKEPSGNWNKLENWLDVGGRKRTTWPFGQNASAWDGKHSVAVWQRHHITGEKKSSFRNCDIMAARVDGWKPVDADGVPVAASGDEEKRPTIASDGAGSLVCVYERHEKSGRVVIAGRMLSTAK